MVGFAFAQTLPDVVTEGATTKKNVLKELNKTIVALGKLQDTATINQNTDTIIFTATHKLDVVKIIYQFNIEQYDEKYCGTQIFEFGCSACANQHLKSVLQIYGFKKMADNQYLSKYYMHTQLQVVYGSAGQPCLTLIFTHANTPKKQYKQLYNSLAKPTNIN